jgi:hypothetical protein
MEFAKIQLTLPDKIDPADEMSWQHYLYSKLGQKKTDEEGKPMKIDEIVERIVAMSKVLYGLHMVSQNMTVSVSVRSGYLIWYHIHKYIFCNMCLRNVSWTLLHFPEIQGVFL